VQFVKYEEILPTLSKQGIVEVEDEQNFIRFDLNPDLPIGCLHFSDPQSNVLPRPDAITFSKSKEAIPAILDHVIGKLHLSEVLVTPVGLWKQILDTVAFDLAADEDWLEIDAMSALHLNTRNALAVPRAETRVLVDMMASLLKNAGGPQHDLIITSESSPVLFELFYDGALSIATEAGIAEQLAKSLA